MTHPLYHHLDTLASTLKNWRTAIGLTSQPNIFGRIYIARDDEETSDVELTNVHGSAPATAHLILQLSSYEKTCLESGEAVLQHLETNVPILQGQEQTLCISAQPNPKTGPKFCFSWGERTVFGRISEMNNINDVLKNIDAFILNAQHLQPGRRRFQFNDSKEIYAQNVNDAYALFCALWYPKALTDPKERNHLYKVCECLDPDTLAPTRP